MLHYFLLSLLKHAYTFVNSILTKLFLLTPAKFCHLFSCWNLDWYRQLSFSVLNDKHVVIWEDAFSPYASVTFFSLFPNILATFTPSCKMRLWLISSYGTGCSLCLKVWQLQKNPVMGHPSRQLALKWEKTIQERKLLTLCHHQGNRKHWTGMRAERESPGVEKKKGKNK